MMYLTYFGLRQKQIILFVNHYFLHAFQHMRHLVCIQYGRRDTIHTVDDMESQKDETDKCIWYCEISTKECYIIQKECQVQNRVFCHSTFHTRIHSPYAINYSQFVNYLKILTRKCMGNVNYNAVQKYKTRYLKSDT